MARVTRTLLQVGVKRIFSLASAALIFCAFEAQAQQPTCGQRAEILRQLAGEEYQEQPVGSGLADGGLILELLVGPRTWTLIATRPKGHTCLISTGQHWEATQPEPPHAAERGL